MNVQVTARHEKVTQNVQDFVKSEIENLTKYYEKITSAHVIFDAEHALKTVEILLHISGKSVTAKAKEDNIGKAVDSALDKVARQLKKVNEKVKDHKVAKIEPEVEEV